MFPRTCQATHLNNAASRSPDLLTSPPHDICRRIFFHFYSHGIEKAGLILWTCCVVPCKRLGTWGQNWWTVKPLIISRWWQNTFRFKKKKTSFKKKNHLSQFKNGRKGKRPAAKFIPGSAPYSQYNSFWRLFVAASLSLCACRSFAHSSWHKKGKFLLFWGLYSQNFNYVWSQDCEGYD